MTSPETQPGSPRGGKFTSVRFLRFYVWRGADREFNEGEVAELSNFLADDLIARGVAVPV